MSAVMTGVGTAATAAFTSALTTCLWNSGTRLVRSSGRPGPVVELVEAPEPGSVR